MGSAVVATSRPETSPQKRSQSTWIAPHFGGGSRARIWAGNHVRFPLCESFRVATLALVFTWMRLQVIKEGAETVDGLSPVERGFERRRQPATRGAHAGSDRVLLAGNHSPRVRAEERARLISLGETLTTRWQRRAIRVH